MSCFKPSLCTEERERGRGRATGKGKGGERAGREGWVGLLERERGRGKREREREGGVAGKVERGWWLEM